MDRIELLSRDFKKAKFIYYKPRIVKNIEIRGIEELKGELVIYLKGYELTIKINNDDEIKRVKKPWRIKGKYEWCYSISRNKEPFCYICKEEKSI